VILPKIKDASFSNTERKRKIFTEEGGVKDRKEKQGSREKGAVTKHLRRSGTFYTRAWLRRYLKGIDHVSRHD